MKKAALVIMAAGMASRYGGNKQIDGMGPNGEILLEYSIRDAIRAGFTKVVFIIKPEILDKMKEICEAKYGDKIELCYAYQDFSSVPGVVPAERVKPFGTVHAVLCAKDFVQEPFAVINADDYYGVESFGQMYGFLTNLSNANEAAMMGYMLKNTVSKYGTVTRGICQVKDECLTGVREIKQIGIDENGQIVNMDDGEALLPESSVSMNFWGFSEKIFDQMGAKFADFVANIEEGNITKEYLLPVYVDEELKAGKLTVRVLPTIATWFGVTYKEDRPSVAQSLKELHDKGIY